MITRKIKSKRNHWPLSLSFFSLIIKPLFVEAWFGYKFLLSVLGNEDVIFKSLSYSFVFASQFEKLRFSLTLREV